MDLDFSEEQKMLKNWARDLLEKECPKAAVREMQKDEKGYSPELWQKMTDQGWLGLVFPEAYGGADYDLMGLVVLLEEMGRALMPGPYFSTVVLGGMPILDLGTEAQKQEYLPKIAKGQMIMTMALTEPSATWEASGVAVKATPEGDNYVINGTKLFVHNAHIADCILTVARTKESADPTDGITLFLVDGKSPGISTTVLQTIDSSKQCEVAYNNVKVSKANVLGEVDKGWLLVEKILDKAAVAQCAEMVGGAQAVLDMTVNYAKERVQFGRPIGSFQAIQHHCANMVTDVDGSRYITYEAAWKVNEGLPAKMEVAMAKAWVSDAYRRVTQVGHQVHGGIGFCEDHDMPLYYKRAKANEVTFGDADFHRKAVAANLGL